MLLRLQFQQMRMEAPHSEILGCVCHAALCYKWNLGGLEILDGSIFGLHKATTGNFCSGAQTSVTATMTAVGFESTPLRIGA